jgi:glycosyltransferase involved in cell wall biosynthesis
MRIALNTTSLLSPLTGIGQYSRHLAQGLASTHGIEPDFFYGAFWQKSVRAEPVPASQSILPWIRRHVPGSYAIRRLIQTQRFSAHAKHGRFDLYHEPNILPMPFDGPTVVTVHDLSWIKYPHTHPAERVRAMNKYFEAGLRQASLLLTDSEFIKQEIIETFGVDANLIKAIPLGVEPLFRPYTESETLPVLIRHSLQHGRYILAVGTLEPRKNLELALRAYAQLPPNLRMHYPLVLVGMAGWLTSTLDSSIQPLLDSGEVRRLGYLARADLARIMAGAAMLVYPSLYEGFGLPPLESMACGVPTIVSNISSLPEVVGDAGLLIDPLDVESLRLAIEKLINDPELRSLLSAAGRERSLDFTWENCVAATVQAYRHALTKK